MQGLLTELMVEIDDPDTLIASIGWQGVPYGCIYTIVAESHYPKVVLRQEKIGTALAIGSLSGAMTVSG